MTVRYMQTRWESSYVKADNMNVIVIMEDSIRKDHLGCYGNTWIKTPNIDKFASGSVIFNHAYAEGLPTIPVRTSLFTGRYTLPFRRWQPLEQLDMPIAEILWDKGVTSALISDTHFAHKPQMSFCRGFDYVKWIRGHDKDPWIVDPDVKVDLSKYSRKNWELKTSQKDFEQSLKNRECWKDEENFMTQIVKAGTNWLEDMVSDGKRDNLFLWFDSFDPHEPWDPPTYYTEMYPVPDYDGLPIVCGGGFVDIDDWTLAEVRHIRSQYAGTITIVDKWTGLFLEKVEELGLLDNTTVIFLSDHGEPLGEHGLIMKFAPWPYDELSRVPLFIRFPDNIQVKSKYLDDFVGMPDIAPTILNLFNIKVPEVMQGRSLLPLVQGEGEAMKFGISGYGGRSWSIRDHERSFYLWLSAWGGPTTGAKDKPELYKYDADFFPPQPARYELERDQAERENLAVEEKDIAGSMEKDLRTFIESLSPSPGDLMAKEFWKRQMNLMKQ